MKAKASPTALAVRIDSWLLGEQDVGEDDGPDDRLPGYGSPTASRTALRIPSAPTTYAAASSPATPSAPRTSSVTPAASAQSGHLGRATNRTPASTARRSNARSTSYCGITEQVVEAGGERVEGDGIAAEEADAVDGPAVTLQLVGETTGVELLQGAGVQDEGAGEVADPVRALLDEGHGDTGGGEVPASRRPVGPAPTTITFRTRWCRSPCRSWRPPDAGTRWSTFVGQRLFTKIGSPLWTVNNCYGCLHARQGTPAPAASPAARRSDTTRTAILTAARERFAADGYERATIRSIAKDARIDPSMVMRYYGSKEGLFAAVLDVDLRSLPDPVGVDPHEAAASWWATSSTSLGGERGPHRAAPGRRDQSGRRRAHAGHLPGPAHAGRAARAPTRSRRRHGPR